MKKFIPNKYLLLSFRIILALVFIYAGIEKISNPEDFAQAIANYKLLPISFVNLFALVLPWLELISGILLLFGVAVKENSFIITFLLAIFIIAISVSLFRGLDISCGCFGTKLGTKVGLTKVLENVGLFLLGIILIIFSSDFLTLGVKVQSSESTEN
jgi:uncharacterized membrane protein YphA (DoxX/SURF4 family)